MNTWTSRLKASLTLTPAILLLLVWIGTFSGMEVVAKIGVAKFVIGSFVAALVMAYCVTLYVDIILDSSKRK